MSTRYKNGSHYENHQQAAQMHDAVAHAHRIAQQHGSGDHLTGHEHSRLALEHSTHAHRLTQSLSVERPAGIAGAKPLGDIPD